MVKEGQEQWASGFCISLTIFCLAGLPVAAGEQQSESSRLKQEITDQIESSNQLDPVCLDEFKPVAKVLQLIDQKKQCFKLPTDIFDFKKDASQQATNNFRISQDNTGNKSKYQSLRKKLSGLHL